MFRNCSYVLKHAAIRLVTDSLENPVPIILTWHFEASQWAENTNKSHELNSLVVLPDSFTWIAKEEMLPLSANQLHFFHWRKESMSSKLETHTSQVLRKRLAYPWGKLWDPSQLWSPACRRPAGTTTCTGDLRQSSLNAYFLGYKGNHSNCFRCKHQHFKL